MQRSPIRLIRVLRVVSLAAATLTLSVASAAPARALPAGAQGCAAGAAKQSSASAICGRSGAAAATSTETVALPRGAASCPSTAVKPSSAAAACAGAAGAAATPATVTVTLTAANPALAPGGTTTLTGTTNLDLAPTPYYLEIFDATTKVFLVECGFGTTCTTSVTQSGQAVHYYVAYVSGLGGTIPPPNIQATSDLLVVSWLTVSLSADNPVQPPGGNVLLTAATGVDVGPTPFWIVIFDTAGGFVVSCGTGSTCSVFVTFGSAIRTYVAYIAGSPPQNFPPPNIRAQSNSLRVTWISAALSTSATSLLAGGTISVTGFSSLDVGPTPYWIEVFDQTTGAWIAICASGTTCTTTVTQSAPGQHSYIAYVAALSGAPPPPDVRATGGPVVVTWTPIQFVTVPDLINADDGDVPAILNAAGLVLGSDSEVVDCGHLGKVAHQSPAAGASVAAGTAVSVTHGVQPTPPAECP